MKKALVILFSLNFFLLIQACSNTPSTKSATTPSIISSTTPSITKNNKHTSANSSSNVNVTHNKVYFKKRLITENDNEKATIKISTINGFQKRPRNKKTTWANNYITALIDKETGEISYKINSLIQYKDHDKHLYKEVSYNTGLEFTTTEASILNHDISCLGSAYSGCIHTEHVAFPIESTLIETIAASYTENSQNKWRYKLSPKKGRSYSAFLFIAEISALVETAHKKRATKN